MSLPVSSTSLHAVTGLVLCQARSRLGLSEVKDIVLTKNNKDLKSGDYLLFNPSTIREGRGGCVSEIGRTDRSDEGGTVVTEQQRKGHLVSGL